MEFVTYSVSGGWTDEKVVTINTLGELLKFAEEKGEDVILIKSGSQWELEVYDGYRE